MKKLYKLRRTQEVLLEISNHLLVTPGSTMDMVVLCKSHSGEMMTISRCALEQIADVVD